MNRRVRTKSTGHLVLLSALSLILSTQHVSFAKIDKTEGDLKIRDYSSPYTHWSHSGALNVNDAKSVDEFLAAKAKIAEAEAYAKQYAAEYPGVNDYHVKVIREARAKAAEVEAAEIASAVEQIGRKVPELTGQYPMVFAGQIESACTQVLRIDAKQPNCVDWIAKVAALKNAEGAKKSAELDAAKLPTTKFTGKKWKATESEILDVYKTRYPEPVKKVIVKSDFKHVRNKFSASEYQDIEAWVVGEQRDGCRVFSMTFRRSRPIGAKKWPKLDYLSVGNSYLMRCDRVK